MATVYRPKDSRYWHGRVQRKGRDLRKSLRTTSQSVARKRLEAWVRDLDNEVWGEHQPISYTEMMDYFMEHHFPDLRPRTAERYMTSIDKLDPFFNTLHINELTKGAFLKYEQARRREGVSPTTIIRDLRTISSAFEEICTAKDLEFPNPVNSYLRLRRKKGLRISQGRKRYLILDVESEVDEEKALLSVCQPALADAVAFAIDTGLRAQEQHSLTWEQVDMKRRLITVDASTSKTDRERDVPIIERAYRILQKQPRYLRSKPDYVFRKPDGTRYQRRDISDAAKRAGLKHLWWHDLRRTRGCRMLAEGYKMEEVSKWLGHASVTVTEKVYAFVEIETLRRKAGMETGIGNRQKDDA